MATVTGTAGADLLQGTGGADTLLGLGGNDTLLAGAGLDSLDGGAGEDRAVIDRAAATEAITLYMLAPALVSALAGDSVTGVEHLSFTAGAGDDGLVGGGGDDSLAGGSGQDALQGGAGADTLLGGDGADSLLGGAGADLLAGGAGADRFFLQGSGGLDSSLAATDRIQDFNAAEGDRLVLRGEAIGTALLALAGQGFALSGQASLPLGFAGSLTPRAAPVGGLGLPDRTGGLGLNLYWQPATTGGGWILLDLDRDGMLAGTDLVVRLDLAAGEAVTAASFIAGTFAGLGTTGADALSGTAAADRLFGFGANDTLAGLAGDDTLLGGDGSDSLAGGAGFDSLLGADGADTLDGGDDTDVLDGGAGDDALAGGSGDDLLLGGAGDDLLQGGGGDDRLQGGFGADTLDGGAGADTLLLQGMGEASWSTLAAPDRVIGFLPAEGDRLRLSNAWFGRGDGGGADAGTYTGADGLARALLFSGSTGTALAAPVAGMALPAQGLAPGGLEAYQVYWIPGLGGGGWLVLDLDRNARLDSTDLVVRLDGLAGLAPEDFVDGTFLTLAGGFVIAGTAGDDSLAGGSLGETFLASPGSDRIAGGAGAGNGLSYAGLAGPVAVSIDGYAMGSTAKPDGARDSFSGIQVIAGTAGADTLDAAAAADGFFALSLEGREGADLLVGNGTAGVQLSYAASPGAISLDLLAGSGSDGWGSTDTLVGIRRVLALSAFGDTVLGSAGDDVFLSGAAGNKTFDGRAGTDEWRYAGEGAISVMLGPSTVGGFAQGAYVLKPGGTDRLSGIEVVTGGAGDDSVLGSAAAERLAGGAGNDTLDGGNNFDVADYGAGGGLATRGVTVDLTAGSGADAWGGTDVLRNIESAWGTPLGDELTGFAIAGAYTWLRGLAGNDTLRAPAAGTMVGADHAGDPAGILADLAAGTVRDGWGGTDALQAIGVVRGSPHADRIAGGAGAETLLGGGGGDTLDGGAGADWLEGGPGDDLFYVEAAGDLVLEAADEGADTVVAALAWALGPDLEVLVLAEAAGGAYGIGNGGTNLLLGNGSGNVLDGGGDADTLRGGGGGDSLYGSAGDDLLDGQDGDDALVGGAGADTLRGGDGDDIIIADADGRFTGTLLLDAGEAAPRPILLVNAGTFADSIEGGSGLDRWFANQPGSLLDLRLLPLAMQGIEEVYGSAGDDVLLLAPQQAAASVTGGDGSDTLAGTDGGDRLDGSAGDDLLAGGGGDDTLSGGPGDDTLAGGAGHDLLDGLAGHDILRGGSGEDTLVSGDWDLLLDGGPGEDLALIDRGFAVAGLTLTAALLTDGAQATALAGMERLSVRAGAGADLLQGGAGADTLDGGGGGDWLDGGAGANALLGSGGDDTLVSAGWDLLLAGGEGQDLAILDRSGSGRALTMRPGSLSDGVSATGWTGIERLDAAGSALADILLGGAGADTLRGGGGEDTLDGGAGADLLLGGPGDDSYRVDDVFDAILEHPGEGHDTVVAFVGTYLPAGVEVLVLAAGAGPIYGVGEAQANVLLGNEAGNLLIGADGDDTLLGAGGNDILFGEQGGDSLAGDEGDDYLFGGAGDDTLVGGEGFDVLYGEAGNDSLLDGPGLAYLIAGAGDDTLDGGEGADVLYGEEGDDRLAGGPDFVFDLLVAGPGNDRLDGASGFGDFDYLYGGPGDDTFLVDTPADLVFEFPGEGHDTVFADIRGAGYYLFEDIEVLVLLGSTPFGVGNRLDNRLTGNAVGNWLLGGAGDDTLEGRGGDDVLFGEAGADAFVVARGMGADVIGDFGPGTDRVEMSGMGFASFAGLLAATTDYGGTCLIDCGQGDQLVLQNVGKDALLAGDFLFG
ncbi:calcium-binding protein [Paeniroseomonas aquatica]|uniref:Calcium-binding protein n=1 Tax=Paeniroseomonas aquatica TaxID=373043 RepID=A0ABT8A4N4_9PROT|nr:calcium-binding protein [Paeniroseomonas aquatica]MDN3564651.1 calcium-binding protein [Paeniroseomonas aquatica]